MNDKLFASGIKVERTPEGWTATLSDEPDRQMKLLVKLTLVGSFICQLADDI